MQHLTLVLLVACAAAAVVVAEPEPAKEQPFKPVPLAHNIEKRNLKSLLHSAKTKISHVVHKINLDKLKNCLKQTPGVPAAVKGVVTGCASSAAAGMGAIAACAAKKAAIPAARATSHLAVCMG